MESLMSVKDVAKILSISERTVYRLLEEKLIGSYMIGGQRKFSKDQVCNYMEASRDSVPPKPIEN